MVQERRVHGGQGFPKPALSLQVPGVRSSEQKIFLWIIFVLRLPVFLSTDAEMDRQWSLRQLTIA